MSEEFSYVVEHIGLEEYRRLLGDGLTTDEIAAAVHQMDKGGAQTALTAISAETLYKTELPPMHFVVDNLLPVGLNILASPPKYGKSWMALDLCLSVAYGKSFLGFQAHPCTCLYLALEDSYRRLKSRMEKLLDGEPAPDWLHFATNAPPVDNGLFDTLDKFLKEHKDTGLVVIDTLQKVRGASGGKEGAYAADYREVGGLKSFADQNNLCLLLAHHLRKMKDDGDPFNMISGTNGIMGAADTTMVLTKEKRGDDTATLSVVGRDVESIDLVLRFDKESCKWRNMGDADAFAERQARREYQENPIVEVIKKLVEQSPEGWSGTAQELLDAGRYITGTSLSPTARDLSSKLKRLDKPLLEYDGIVHTRASHGTGGGKHRFSYASPKFEELDQQQLTPFDKTSEKTPP